jgi:arginase
VRQALAPALASLAGRVQRIYLHLDLDVLDPQVAPANSFATPGGLAVEQVLEAIRLIRETFQVVGASLASYEPEGDKDQRALRAGLRLLDGLVQTAPSV